MTLKLRHAAKGDVTMEISNLISIKDFKAMYVEKLSDDTVQTTGLRFFAMGKELKDDLFVYSYDILNESTVQVMIRKPVAD
mmetsp:Transcript_22383/g.34643  ORF Transcript_22383/g.34643 Transcript_22383/m.34643 type:complete len:81 (-) Transcript_22383:20-262(-)